MYRISFKSSVSKDLSKIPEKQVVNILDKIDSDLSENPDHFPELKGKFKGLRKYRVGDYRIIYSILDGEEVLILRINHRKEVYK